MKPARVYDGSLWCDKCDKCPVVELTADGRSVVIHDPDKPENGAFTMTVEQYNALISNARPVMSS